MNDDEANAWWSQLRHHGVLLSPVVLREWLPNGPFPVDTYRADRLRESYQRFKREPERLRQFLDDLFENFLGHQFQGAWKKEQHVPERFKRKGRRPNRVLTNAGKEHDARFVVVIDDEHVARDDGTPYRVGVHGGRKAYADLLRLLRDTKVPLGILTNGHSVRLVFSGIDHESWIEWNIATWFEGGEFRRGMDGFYALLSSETLPSDFASTKNELLARIQQSRERQADLSHVMSTQIRESVELLLEDVAEALRGPHGASIIAPLRAQNLRREQELGAVYQAAIRHVMRLVVVLYAESRRLLPADDRHSQVSYHNSYGVEGLYQLLRQAAIDGREESLLEMRSAWPRILSLNRAIYEGSGHNDLQVQAYGGQLFRPHTEGDVDEVLCALRVIEHPEIHVSDWTIYRILEKLRVGRFKVGRGSWLAGPVDFSDLRTEYIGMMYEGLLDYDLREARSSDGGIVFLRLGDQPALSLNVLESLSDQQIRDLLEDVKKGSPDEASDPEAEQNETDSDDSVRDDGDEDFEGGDEAAEEVSTIAGDFESRVMAWAARAVEAGELFGCSHKRLRKLDAPLREATLRSAASKLIFRIIPPGGLYLVRWSGTRKGSGTFYTRPSLAIPTTQHALLPLIYADHDDPVNRRVKEPNELLKLTVCDAAMGSGSFLVAALRTLAEALKESFETYVIPKLDEGQRFTTAGNPAIGLLTERILEYRGREGEDERLASAYKRAVVEHCIYGVDVNPLAVELGKLALWIETMDPKLRFTFLDHKIKCGNSLIGSWQNQAGHYPLAAWERELGDGKDNPRTAALKKLRRTIVVPQLKVVLEQYDLEKGSRRKASKRVRAIPGQLTLSGSPMEPVQARFVQEEPRLVRKRTTTTITEARWESTSEEVGDYEREVYEKLHTIVDPAEQERDYRKLILENEGHRRQKSLLDMWCAVWFWPIRTDADGAADPGTILSPELFYREREQGRVLPEAIARIVAELAQKYRFFHWELEFPEVFGRGRFGFDALLGNPPWETAKPRDIEFFTRYDPAYRTYGKQKGLERQDSLFATNPEIQQEFWDYEEFYRAQSNFVRNCHRLENPRFGSAALNEKWDAMVAPAREIIPGRPTPYVHQGEADLNLYKLFTEIYVACAASRARVGIIAPLGLALDKGCQDLRAEIHRGGGFNWIVSYWNKDRIFRGIPSQNRFASFIFDRGEKPALITAALIRAPEKFQWETDPRTVEIHQHDIATISPLSQAIPEITDARDLSLLKKIASAERNPWKDGVLEFGREFDTTGDRGIATNLKRLSAPKNEGTHVLAGEEIYVPILQGKMVHVLSGIYQGVESPNEPRKWVKIAPSGREFWCNRYAVKKDYIAHSKRIPGPKIAVRNLSQPTINPRTMLASVIPDWPTFHALNIISSPNLDELVEASAVLCSLVFDFAVRFRISGMMLGGYAIAEVPFPSKRLPSKVLELAAALQIDPRFFDNASLAKSQFSNITPLRDEVGRASAEEQIDEAVANAYGLTEEDMRDLLRPDNTDPRGLWTAYCERLKVLESGGARGRWYSLEEARERRKLAGLKVDF